MNPYVAVLLLFAFGASVAVTFLLLSRLFASRGPRRALATPYECGVDPVGSTRERLPVKFYLVAMIFILFDVEVVFLYPWAVLFREFHDAGAGLFLFVEMLIFLSVLAVGLLYLYGRRALEWE